MHKRIPRELARHDYFFVDFWSSIALISTGILSLFINPAVLDSYGSIKGFMYTVGSPCWQVVFIGSGALQFYTLFKFRYFKLRGFANIISSFIFVCTLLNIIVYGPVGFNYSTVGWAILTCMSLYGLWRIVTRVEKRAVLRICRDKDK